MLRGRGLRYVVHGIVSLLLHISIFLSKASAKMFTLPPVKTFVIHSKRYQLLKLVWSVNI